ncbi:MAG: hypothetical protein ACRD4F_01480, partial [Candidatus Angelobacter sp.]
AWVSAPVDSGKFFAGAAADSRDGLREFSKVIARGRLLQQTCAEQDMQRRMIAPVGKQVIDFPEGKPVNFTKRPSGSGGDMAVKKWPAR